MADLYRCSCRLITSVTEGLSSRGSRIMTWPGDPQVDYSVNITVRGVIELKKYISSTQTTDDGAYVLKCETSVTPYNTSISADPYNVYRLAVLPPAEAVGAKRYYYFLNRDWKPGNVEFGKALSLVYTSPVPIKIRGGSTLQLFAFTQDSHIFQNPLTSKTWTHLTVPGVCGIPSIEGVLPQSIFTGQFMQVNFSAALPPP